MAVACLNSLFDSNAMKSIDFEWDRKKENANIKKHGVSFDEARTAFYDEHAIQFYDPCGRSLK